MDSLQHGRIHPKLARLKQRETQDDIDLHGPTVLAVRLHTAPDSGHRVDFRHQSIDEVVFQLHVAPSADVDDFPHQFSRQRGGFRGRAQPGLGVQHGQRGERVPCHVPDHFLPSAALDVFQDPEPCLSCLQERGEGVEAGLFERLVDRGVREEADLRILRFGVLHDSGAGLGCSDP